MGWVPGSGRKDQPRSVSTPHPHSGIGANGNCSGVWPLSGFPGHWRKACLHCEPGRWTHCTTWDRRHYSLAQNGITPFPPRQPALIPAPLCYRLPLPTQDLMPGSSRKKTTRGNFGNDLLSCAEYNGSWIRRKSFPESPAPNSPDAAGIKYLNNPQSCGLFLRRIGRILGGPAGQFAWLEVNYYECCYRSNAG